MKNVSKAALATMGLAASLTMLLAGCGGNNPTSPGTNSANSTGQTADKPVDGGTLTIGQATKYEQQFIPGVASDLYTANIVAAAYDPLLTVNKDLQFIPDLAKSWTWSDDKKSLTITLADAKWSDGQPITSDDILYTINFLGSKDYATTLQGQYGYLVGSIVGADKIANGKATSFADTGGFKKIDDKSFTLTFQAVDAAVLWSQVSGIQPIPMHALQGSAIKDWATSQFDQMPTVVSGPYTFTKVNGQDSVEMAANPTYFQGKPHIASLVWKTVNADVAPGLLANGTIDYMANGLKPNDVDKLKAISNLNIFTPPDMGYQYMGFKLYQKEFQDVKVRQAFMYAIDRQSMIQGLLKGYGQVINGPLPDVSWAAAKASDGMNDYAYNVDKANQLLDAAGWKVGSDGWRIDPVTGQTANIPLDYPLGNTVRMASATAIAQDLAKVHIKINLHQPSDFSALSKKVENDDKSVYLWLMGWSLSIDPDPRGMWNSNDAFNFPRWKDSKNDDLIKATWDAAAFDQNTRKQALVAWQVYVNQQLPYVFLYQADDVYAMNKRVHIPSDDMSVLGPLNMYQWWVTNN